MRQPGFLRVLQDDLEKTPLEILNKVNEEGGLEICDFLDCIVKPVDYTVVQSDPLQENIFNSCNFTQAHTDAGKSLLREGKIAFCHAGELPPGYDKSNSWSFAEDSRHYYTFSLHPDNRLILEDSSPVLRPCGSGDILERFLRSDFYRSFLERGGKHVVFLTRPNATVTPDAIGLHDESNVPLTALVKKSDSREDAVLVETGGFNQLVGRFRLSEETSDVLHSHTGVTLMKATTDFSSFKWQWHRRKLILHGRLEVVYQRYIEDITAHFKTQFVESK